MAFRSTDPTAKDYGMPDDFAEGVEVSTRKRKAPEADKTKKKTKWKSAASSIANFFTLLLK